MSCTVSLRKSSALPFLSFRWPRKRTGRSSGETSSVDFFELAIMALILEQQERRWTLDDLHARVEQALTNSF